MAMTNYEMGAITTPPLSTQLDQLNTALANNPRRAQQMANVPRPTIDALVAQRVLNDTAKKKREVEEELFVNRTGDPQTTVNDDLKMRNVALAKDLTNLEMGKAGQVGALAQQQQRPPGAGIGNILPGNRPPMGRPPMGGPPMGRPPMGSPTGGVNMLAANNMRGMPSGGITQRPSPMPMPTARAAGGGLVAFNEGNLVEVDAEKPDRKDVADALQGNRNAESTGLTGDSAGVVGFLQSAYDRREAAQNAARQKVLDKVAADKGVFSDAVINRLLAFGGTENIAQGFIRSGEAGQRYRREQEARTQRELERIDKQESGLDALISQALLGAGELKQKEIQTAATIDISIKELELKRDQYDANTEFENKKLDMLIDRLDFDIDNEGEKRRLEGLRTAADTAYKEATVAVNKYKADTDRDELAVRLAAHRNDYIRQMTALMSSALPTDPTELETKIIDLVEGFSIRLKNDLETMGVGGEFPPLDESTGRVTNKLTDEEIQKIVDEYLKKNQPTGDGNKGSSATDSTESGNEGIAALNSGPTNYQSGPLRPTPEEIKRLQLGLQEEPSPNSNLGIAAR